MVSLSFAWNGKIMLTSEKVSFGDQVHIYKRLPVKVVHLATCSGYFARTGIILVNAVLPCRWSGWPALMLPCHCIQNWPIGEMGNGKMEFERRMPMPAKYTTGTTLSGLVKLNWCKPSRSPQNTRERALVQSLQYTLSSFFSPCPPPGPPDWLWPCRKTVTDKNKHEMDTPKRRTNSNRI